MKMMNQFNKLNLNNLLYTRFKRPLKFRADVCRHAQQRAAMDRPLYGKRVREMSNSMCNMRALHRRLERAGPRRLTFPFARFRRIGSCRASYAIRVGAAACTSSHTWAYSTFAGGQP